MSSVLDHSPGKTRIEKCRWQFRHVAGNRISALDKASIDKEIAELCEAMAQDPDITPEHQIQYATIIGRFMSDPAIRDMQMPDTHDWSDEHYGQREAAVEVFNVCLQRMDQVIGYTP